MEDAFLHYMGRYNHGRKVVLIGHSQGAGMIVHLLQSRFEHDPVMMSRLLLAMPIGGPVEVPKGATVGATFDSIPLCTKPDETACVIAYQSRSAGGKVGKPAFARSPETRSPASTQPPSARPASTASRAASSPSPRTLAPGSMASRASRHRS